MALLGGSKCTSSMGKSIGGHKICQLYRSCPLFGESAIRGFTVVKINRNSRMKLRHYYLCATVLLIVVVVIIKFGETPYKVKEEFVKLSFHNEDFQSKPVSGETRQPLQEELVSSSTASVSLTTKSLSPPYQTCLLYTSPSPRDRQKSRMPSSA